MPGSLTSPSICGIPPGLAGVDGGASFCWGTASLPGEDHVFRLLLARVSRVEECCCCCCWCRDLAGVPAAAWAAGVVAGCTGCSCGPLSAAASVDSAVLLLLAVACCLLLAVACCLLLAVACCLLLAVACCCRCCCRSLADRFPLGSCWSRAAVMLRRLSLLARSLSARFWLGFLLYLLPPAAATDVAVAAGGKGLLEREKNSPSGRCSTVNLACWPAATHARYTSQACMARGEGPHGNWCCCCC